MLDSAQQMLLDNMLKLIAFAVLSAGLIYISRASLLAPRSHGFYRFFAWELIVALALLNIDSWFHDSFSWHQLISWPKMTEEFALYPALSASFGVQD